MTEERRRDTKVTVFISVAAGWCCLQASPPSFATRRTCRVPETITDMLELIVSCVDICTVSRFKGFKAASVLTRRLYLSLRPATSCSVDCKRLSACLEIRPEVGEILCFFLLNTCGFTCVRGNPGFQSWDLEPRQSVSACCGACVQTGFLGQA